MQEADGREAQEDGDHEEQEGSLSMNQRIFTRREAPQCRLQLSRFFPWKAESRNENNTRDHVSTQQYCEILWGVCVHYSIEYI